MANVGGVAELKPLREVQFPSASSRCRWHLIWRELIEERVLRNVTTMSSLSTIMFLYLGPRLRESSGSYNVIASLRSTSQVAATTTDPACLASVTGSVTLPDAATAAPGATGRSFKAARRCNGCCQRHRTLLQGCWTFEQVDRQDVPARLLDAATGAVQHVYVHNWVLDVAG